MQVRVYAREEDAQDNHPQPVCSPFINRPPPGWHSNYRRSRFRFVVILVSRESQRRIKRVIDFLKNDRRRTGNGLLLYVEQAESKHDFIGAPCVRVTRSQTDFHSTCTLFFTEERERGVEGEREDADVLFGNLITAILFFLPFCLSR